MKQFDKNVLFQFKISIDGYGKNVKEALERAAEHLAYQVESEFTERDLESIETHECVIDQNNTLPDDML